MKLVAVILLALLLAPQQKSAAQKAPDLTSPEAAVRSLIGALSEGDYVKAAHCISGAPADSAVAAAGPRPTKTSIPVSKLTVDSHGDKATVSFTIGISGQAVNDSLTVARAGGSWKIVPSDTAAMKQEYTTHPVRSVVYSIAHPEVLGAARDKARESKCLSNVKQLSLACMMFVQDYNQKFELKASSYKKSLMPYLKNDKVFSCPADKDDAGSYTFNPNLEGVKISAISMPSATVMLYEGKKQTLDFRHDGKAAVGFADGHTRMVNAAGAKDLRWKP